MAEYSEVKIKRILNETAIDLGEYVINPFMGCEYACLYCYVRSNRVVSRKNRPWGEYVDIRVNTPEQLEREIKSRRPKTVLLGSTTECFQPAERKYRITQRVLEILNKNRIYYCILTRSPLILDYKALLKEGYLRKIYFTVNRYSPEFKLKLEPLSPSLELRDQAVNTLLSEGLNVAPYYSPVIPWVSDINDIFTRFKSSDIVEFECLNFSIGSINDIIARVAEVEPSLKERYEKMLESRLFYARTWRDIERSIRNQADAAKKRYNIYIHKFGGYFENTYK